MGPNLFTPFTTMTADERPVYSAVSDEASLRQLLSAKLAEYNETHVAMDLVFFQQVTTSHIQSIQWSGA